MLAGMATHELADGVRVLGLRTPTLPPATATNTLVVGRRRLAVIEPATPYDEERRSLDALLERLVAAGGEVVAILRPSGLRSSPGSGSA